MQLMVVSKGEHKVHVMYMLCNLYIELTRGECWDHTHILLTSVV